MLSLSTTVPRLSVKAPDSVPAFVMSTVPTRAGSPGRMSAVLDQTASPCLELVIDSVPVANVVSAFADVAVKSAPEAAVMPTATSTVASAASVRRGRETRTDRRDIRVTLLGEGVADDLAASAQSCDDLSG